MAMSEELIKAQKKQDELAAQIAGSQEIQKQRPLFHFATPGGWCNDPNGFSQFKDKVHLFYQYHPYSTQWGPMHWGHVTSSDMIEWKLEPVALAPDSKADFQGCFSGTAIEDEGKHVIAYTGVSHDGVNEVQNQCIAIGDGTTYEKLSEEPLVTASNIPFAINPEHFRDPKIFKKDGIYYMACVIKLPGDVGAMVLFASKDLKNWNYHGMIDHSKDGLSGMWECPDVTNIDGRDILIFSPQEMKADENLGFHDGNNSVYVSGVLNLENSIFDRDFRVENRYTAAEIDYGIDFYAPETTKLADGRTIMIGWMQAWESYLTPKDYMWSGMMTIPRELSFKENRLYQMPVKELEKWKRDLQKIRVLAEKSENIADSAERHFELDFEVNDERSGAVELILGDSEGEHVTLKIDFSGDSISFDRSKSLSAGKISSRKAKLPPFEENAKFKVLVDTCSIEVFVDDGKMAFTNAFFFTESTCDITVKNGTEKNLFLDFWKIAK